MIPSPRWVRNSRYAIYAIILYISTGSILYLIGLNTFPPAPYVPDWGFQKKNYDGPLVLRDELLDEEFRSDGNHIVKAVLMQPNAILPDIDEGIITVNQSLTTELVTEEKVMKKIKTTAQRIQNKSGFVLYTLINGAYLNLTLNWLCNAYALDQTSGPKAENKIHPKVMIVALDKSICTRIHKDWPKVECVEMSADSEYNRALDWGSLGYARVLVARLQQIIAMVEMGLQTVVFETDAIWLKNPLKLFQDAFDHTTSDLTVPKNFKETNGQKFAFDPMVIRSTYATKRAFREILSRAANETKLMDQDILNAKCSDGELRCESFKWDDIADGKWFKMSAKERRKYRPYIVNNNYYIGARSKMTRQALNSAWYLSPSLICNTSKAKKLLAKNNNH